MGSSIMITEIFLVLLLITTPQFSTATSNFDARQSGSNGATLKVEKRAANTNPGKAEAGRLIRGDVPIWTRTTDDRSNLGSLITAPAHALQLSAGDTYAPSIMVTATESGNFGALSLQLGQNCTIQGDSFIEKFCPIIHDRDISIIYDDSTAVHTLYFNITIDDRFIDGQDNIIVYFHQEVDQTNYNISGYLYFEDSGCNPSTPITPTDIVTIRCDCATSMTGNSDATPVQTIAACQKLLNITSGSTLSSLYCPGSVFILVVSLLLSAP